VSGMAMSGSGRARAALADLGGGMSLAVCIKGNCANSITTEAMIAQPRNSGARWAFDEAARQLGLNPATIQRGSIDHARVTRVLDGLVDAIKDEALTGTTTEVHGQVRAKITASIAAIAKLDAMGVTFREARAAAAAIGGAPTLSRSTTATLESSTAFARARVPGGAVAAAAGTAAAIAAVKIAGSGAPEPTPKDKPKLTPLAVPLDTDHDGKLQCREIGKWVTEDGYAARELISPNANRYQDFIGGHPGQNFRVIDPSQKMGQTDYDGCRDTPNGAVTLEAKGDHRGMIDQEWYFAGKVGLVDQGRRQQDTANRYGVRNEWHAQTATDRAAIAGLFKTTNPEITTRVLHTPMSEIKR